MLLDPIQARAQFAAARAEGRALLAVNADSPAAVLDCLEAAREAGTPVIIETSLWQLQGRSFGAGDPVLGLARYAADLAVLAGSPRFRDIPVILHTDHIKGPETLAILKAAISGVPLDLPGGGGGALAYSTVSLDSSELSAEQNIETVCALCAHAKAGGRPLTLEMEAGVDDGLTPPEVARALLGAVEERHPGCVWLWAPGCGTRHGFSEAGYPAFSAEHVRAQARLAREITGRDLGIALHGSSGLPEEALRAAVAAGVVKVNWSSESLLLRSAAAREYYATHAERLDKKHPGFKAAAMDNGLQEFIAKKYVPVVAGRMRLLAGKGS